MGAPSALAAVDGINPPSDGPSIGEDAKKQQSGSTAAESVGIHDHASGKDERHQTR